MRLFNNPMLISVDWSQWALYDPARPMLFNSGLFLITFLVFYGLFLLVRQRVLLRTIYLLAFSLFFYYKSGGWYVALLGISTLVDFMLGHLIYTASTRAWKRLWLWLSIIANLGMLGYFKYTNFFKQTANAWFGSSWELSDIFLPIGISFFTFQTMSYSIDLYRGRFKPLSAQVKGVGSFFRQLLDFGFFVSFFPQLVAGPIVRAAEFIPQIRKDLQLHRADFSRAFFLIMGGLFKKAVISDYISVNFVDRVFEAPSLYSGFEALMAVYGYAIQIYCDFSGYSDMAIGLALLMGFRLPDNFRFPYRAYSLQEFWRRWHISLSTWLRDYLYISLGGNRRGKIRTNINLMVTMLLGGLWHGASWVFVAWGGLHGVGLVIERYARRWFGPNPLWPALMLVTVCLGTGMAWIALQPIPVEGADEVIRHLTVLGNIMFAVLVLALIARLLDKLFRHHRASRVVATLFVFHFVCLAWIFFRSGALSNPNPAMSTAAQILETIARGFTLETAQVVVYAFPWVFGLIGLGLVLHYIPDSWRAASQEAYGRAPLAIQAAVFAFVAWLCTQAASADVVPFIYFQF